MPTYKVTFEPAGKTVEVDPDQYPCGGQGHPGSLLDIALAHGDGNSDGLFALVNTLGCFKIVSAKPQDK